MLAATILGSAITFIDGTVVNVALPVLQHALGTDIVGAQWVVESYALMLSSLILVGGSLGDRKGRRRVFSAGVLLFTLASAACGLAQGVGQLIAARARAGRRRGAARTGKSRNHQRLIPRRGARARNRHVVGIHGNRRGHGARPRRLARRARVVALDIFYQPAARGRRARADLVARAREPRRECGEGRGRARRGGGDLGLGGVVYGLVESGGRGFADARVLASLAAGACCSSSSSSSSDKRGARAMVPLSLFSSRTFAGANLLTLCLYAALSGLMFFLPFNLIQVQGYSPTQAGAALVPFVLTMFLLSRWAGGLVQRHGAKLPLVVGPIVAAAGFALFILPGARAGSYWTSFFPAVMLMSFGMATSVAPLTTAVMGSVEERHAGVASGINNAVSRTAGLISVAVLGVIITGVFARDFNARLRPLNLSDAARAELASQESRLAAVRPPQELSGDARLAVERAVEDSFVVGFRVVMLICAALALASALFAWLLIEGRA